MKKRMKNKMVSIFLVGAMALSACACGSTSPQQEDTAVKESAGNAVESEAVQTTGAEETSGEYVPSYPICEETITITAQGQSTGHTDEWSSTIQFEEYEKRLGIKIETENVYDSETWASKRSLLFASDELPDLLLNSQLTVSEVQAYGKDGYFLDLSQYLDVMPNFKAYMEEYPEWADAMTNENGEIFAILGLNTRSAYALYGIQLINNQWLENLNLEKPETLDELYTVLKAFKDEDANLNGDPDDEIPLLVRSGSSILQTILWGHGIYARKNYFNIQADDNGKVFLADTTDNYREFLKYINKLYTEGLINQDMFTIT